MIVREAKLRNIKKINPISFHFTLLVLHLDEKEETQIQKARDALDQSLPLVESSFGDLRKLSISGLGHFSNKIFYSTMRNEEQISAIKQASAHIRSVFKEHGLTITDERELSPHVTLFKPDFKTFRRQGRQKFDFSKFEDQAEESFGEQDLSVLQLCHMHRDNEDEYYPVLHERPLFASSSNDMTNAMTNSDADLHSVDEPAVITYENTETVEPSSSDETMSNNLSASSESIDTLEDQTAKRKADDVLSTEDSGISMPSDGNTQPR